MSTNEPGATPPGASGPAADQGTSAGSEPRGKPAGADDALRHSRTSGAWIAVVALVVLLVLLAVFVLQNTQSVKISFFGWDGHAPLAAALLIATAAGLMLAIAAGSLRILQLRRRVKHERRSG